MLQTVFFFSGQDRSDEDLFYIREPDVTSVYETVNFSRVIERLAGFSGDVCGNQGGRDMGLQVVVSCSRPLSTIIFWNIGQVYTMVPDSA